MHATDAVMECILGNALVSWIIVAVLLTAGMIVFMSQSDKSFGTWEYVLTPVLGCVLSWMMAGVLQIIYFIIMGIGYTIAHPLNTLKFLLVLAIGFGALYLIMELLSGDGFEDKHYEELKNLKERLDKERMDISGKAQQIYDLSESIEDEDLSCEIGGLADDIMMMTYEEDEELEYMVEEFYDHEILGED